MKKFSCFIMVMIAVSSLWAGGGSQASRGGAVTLNYWLPIHFNAVSFIQTYAENEAYIEVQKRTGININFIHPAQGSESESFNLMMASGDLPDMIQGSARYQGGVTKGMDDGVYIDLEKYNVRQQAPDYWAMINETPAIRREVYDENGRVGAFYKMNTLPKAPLWMRAIVRDDWLKEFNMTAPKTWAQYEQYFQAVQKNKPGAVPFFYPNSDAGVGIQYMYAGFNIWPDFYVADGKIKHGNAEATLKDYLTMLNDWYRKGYISPDFPSLTQQQVWSLFDTGNVGMYWDSVDSSGARVANLPFKIESCPIPRLTENSKMHFGVNLNMRSGDETSIVSTSKNIPAAMKFLNYGFSDEGSMLFNFGIEGKTYNMVNGRAVYTDYILNHPQFTTENANYILRIHFAPKRLLSDLYCNPTVVKSPESVAFRERWSDDPNEDGDYVLPPISLTPEENTRRAEIMTNVNTYTNEMILKFIIGTEPLSNFDRYIAQLNQYGMQEAIRITQAAYDRYMAKK